MSIVNRIIVIIIKTVTILLIPYYLYLDSHTTGGSRMETTYLISNLLGYIHSPGVSYDWSSAPIVFWEQNQLLYSILFILPMILFALYYGNRKPDRNSIIVGIAAILVPFIIVSVTTPYILLASITYNFDIILPNVIIMSMFVFVFWPILRNSWPSIKTVDEGQEQKGKIAQLQKILAEWFPRNVATLVWICCVILPAGLSFYFQLDPGATEYNYQLSGGLYYILHDYWSISGGGYYPTIMINTAFEIASWVSVITLSLWIANIILGIVSLQYIQRETTKKRLYSAIGVVLLINIGPTVYFTIISFAFGIPSIFSIPLPLYPIAMLLLARFANPPQVVTKDMIKVPLRTRIASIFQRGSKETDSQESVSIDTENNEGNDSSSH